MAAAERGQCAGGSKIRKHIHMTGTCAANLDGGGLQNLERLWAGHDAAEAVLAILLEGEALLPRQSAQRAAFPP